MCVNYTTPLLPLWTFVACSRVNFTFTLNFTASSFQFPEPDDVMRPIAVLIRIVVRCVIYVKLMFRASQFNVNKIQPDATVCRYLFTAKSLYMFQVSQHPSSGVLKTVTAASGTGHNIGTATSLLLRPRWREVAVPIF